MENRRLTPGIKSTHLWSRANKNRIWLCNSWVYLCRVCVSFRMMEVEVGHHSVLLTRSEGKFSALGNQCTHYGAPLSKGKESVWAQNAFSLFTRMFICHVKFTMCNVSTWDLLFYIGPQLAGETHVEGWDPLFVFHCDFGRKKQLYCKPKGTEW